jgi:cytosine/adenosine deaminase-related metal-dependent hydrolase
VNAHCHLDYTDMAGMIPPQKSFTDWIKLILAAKAEWNYSEFAASWLNGASMLLRTGTTTVGDFEAVPELIPDVWSATPLRVISFLELTSVRHRRNPRKIVAEAVDRIESLPSGRSRGALAPHAPYSTVSELIRLAAETARKHRWPTSIHLSESAQEFEMLTRGRGEMFTWLKRNERDKSDCGHGSPVALLERHGALGRNLVAVHVNYLAPKDAALLARRGVSVAHCPRSHHYFRHDTFPWRRLTRAGVNVCLATDSLASVYRYRRQPVELNMFEEMRAFAAAWPGASARTILNMATLNGARALGIAGKAGEISRGAHADLIAIPFKGRPVDVFDAVLNHRGDISAGMINGEWVMPPTAASSPDLSTVHNDSR